MQNCLSYFSCGCMVTCINIGVLSHSFQCNQFLITPNYPGLEEEQMCIPTSGCSLTTPLCCPFALTDEMQIFTSRACEAQIRQEEAEGPQSCSSFHTCGEALRGWGGGQCQQRHAWEPAHSSKSLGFIRARKHYGSR